MPRGKPTPNCAECGQPRPLKHIGPPSSRGAAPLDADVIAALRARCDATSVAALSREAGVCAAVCHRALRGRNVSVPCHAALTAHARGQA